MKISKEKKQVFSKEYLPMYIALLTGKALLFGICLIVWIGTFYNPAENIVLYSLISIISAIMFFFAAYRAMSKLYTIGRTNDLEWLTILTILPIFLLVFDYAFTYIFLAGYYVGIVTSEIAFLHRRW